MRAKRGPLKDTFQEEIPSGGSAGPTAGGPQGGSTGTAFGSNKGQPQDGIDRSLTQFLETGAYDEVDMGSIHQVGQED